MIIENSYFSKFSLVEQFLCSAISSIPNEDTFELYEQIDDNIIFETAKKNLVDSIIGFRLLEKYGKHNILPHWINSYKNKNDEIASYLVELDRVAGLFDKKNIRLIALKNSGIARAIYPYPGLVPMGDVDTLVKRSDFIEAHKTLIENNYEIASPNQYHMADVNVGLRTGGSEYKTILPNGKQLWFELQWRPVEGRFLRPDQEPDGNLLVDQSIPVNGTKLRILSPEDNLLQVCLHTAKHSYVRAPGFRLHLDAERIICGQNINWDIFTKNVIDHQVETPTYFSLYIPKILFNTNIPKEVLSQIKPGVIKIYIISKWINKVGIFNPEEKKFGKVSYIIWTTLLYDNFLGLIKSIFPNPNWLKNYYGYNNIFLSPYYYLKRIFELLFHRMKT